MAKAPDYRTSAGQFDGAAPYIISSGAMSFATAAVVAQGGMVPWPATVREAKVSVHSTTATGTATIDVGVTGDDDELIAAYDIKDQASGQVFDMLAATGTLVETDVEAGENIIFTLNIANAATGSVSVTLVLMPRDQ